MQPKPGVLNAAAASVTATVESIDYTTRMISLKTPDGNVQTMEVGPGVVRFNEIKKGDLIQVDYLESVVVVVQDPHETISSAQGSSTVLVRNKGKSPSGTVVQTDVVTATVVKINAKKRKATLRGPDGNVQELISHRTSLIWKTSRKATRCSSNTRAASRWPSTNRKNVHGCLSLKKKVFEITLLACLLSGCQGAAQLRKGKPVQLVFHGDEVQHCQSMGVFIRSEGHWYDYLFISNRVLTQNALNDLRNQAFGAGSDTVLIPPYANIFVTSVTIMGEAFRCRKGES